AKSLMRKALALHSSRHFLRQKHAVFFTESAETGHSLQPPTNQAGLLKADICQHELVAALCSAASPL
ncbi:hypothetical protein ACEWPL_019390, partial [Roseovarius sp. S1116L3]|uniref:hypothetical protein n=1 Tax=Roseovarius roseus TaxID=3342636 RepID=UPI003B679FEF